MYKYTQRHLRRWLTAVMAALPVAGWAASSDNLHATFGIDYSSGKYGNESSTDILYLPLTIRYDAENWQTKVTLPWLSIDSGGEVVIGPGGEIIGGTGQSESGIGDTTIGVTRFVYPGSDTLPMVDVTGKIKIPTADESKGLGTGEMDFSIDTDLIKTIGQHSLFFNLGYKIYGDPPDFDYNNVFYTSIGDAYRYQPGTTLGVFYDAREATTDTTEGMSEIMGYVDHRLNRKWKIMTYGVAGFSDGSPDWGVGIMFTRHTGLDDIRRALPNWRQDLFPF